MLTTNWTPRPSLRVRLGLRTNATAQDKPTADIGGAAEATALGARRSVRKALPERTTSRKRHARGSSSLDGVFIDRCREARLWLGRDVSRIMRDAELLQIEMDVLWSADAGPELVVATSREGMRTRVARAVPDTLVAAVRAEVDAAPPGREPGCTSANRRAPAPAVGGRAW